MSGFVGFTQYQAEALLICLIASLVWAGILLVGARGIESAASIRSAERLWAAALLFAILPSLAAPTLAAFGISLRETPMPVERSLEWSAAAPSMLLTAANNEERSLSISTEQVIGAAALIYVYGVFLSLFLWAARQGGLRFAVARAEFVRDSRLLGRIEEWAARLNARMPAVKRSRHVSSVCITGVMRHTILIPQGIETRVSSDDLVLMCAHELAHVRRGDTRLFTATQLARVLFWFNPLVARIASNAELAAEKSADALVLGAGVDRRAYAACFVEGLKFAAYKLNAQPALTPSFTPSDRNGRRKRLNSILSPEPERRTPIGKRLLLSAAASTVALVSLGQAALAVDPESAADRRISLRNFPVTGSITQAFGEKSRATESAEDPRHDGLDIKAPKGAKIIAPGDGVVTEATDYYNDRPSWGKVVVVDHGRGLVTRYAHLDSYSVKKGQTIKAGDVIAKVGDSGTGTGPHLHFETLRNGEAIDPVRVVAGAGAAPEAPAPATAAAAIAPEAANSEAPTPPIAPRPVIPETPSPAAAPAPVAPDVSEFSFKNAPSAPARSSVDGDAFDGSLLATATAEYLERRLLGAANGEIDGSYQVTLKNGGTVYRFSSDEPMSAAQRSEFRKAAADLRKQAERWRKEAAQQREKWRQEQKEFGLGPESKTDDAATPKFESWGQDLADIRQEFEASRREHLLIQRNALEKARADIAAGMRRELKDAFSDLDAAKRDLESADIPREELAAALAEIREQRRQLERSMEISKRAHDAARRQFDLQIEEVNRMLKDLDEQQPAP